MKLALCVLKYQSTIIYHYNIAQAQEIRNYTCPYTNTILIQSIYCKHCGEKAKELLYFLKSAPYSVLLDMFCVIINLKAATIPSYYKPLMILPKYR